MITHSRCLRGATLRLVAGLAMLCLPGLAAAVVSCTATTSGVAFGIYDPLSPTPTTSTGGITVNCTLLSGAAVNNATSVYLSAGTSGSYAARTMISGTSSLRYNIYFSPSYQQVWGNGTGGSYYGVATLPLSPSSPTQSAIGTFYGQIPAGQDVAPGSYSDTIVVTVNY
jgi:spore coat protein U-like protein